MCKLTTLFLVLGVIGVSVISGSHDRNVACSSLSCRTCVVLTHCTFCVGSVDVCVEGMCDPNTTSVVVPLNATEMCPTPPTTPPPPAPESSSSFWWYVFVGIGFLLSPTLGIIFQLVNWLLGVRRRRREEGRPIGGFRTGIAYRDLEAAVAERRVQLERHNVSAGDPVTDDNNLDGREMPLFVPCPPSPPPSPLAPLTELEIQELFLEFDADRDGVISVQELRVVLMTIDGRVCDDDLLNMIDMFATDGGVNFGAFRNIMLEMERGVESDI